MKKEKIYFLLIIFILILANFSNSIKTLFGSIYLSLLPVLLILIGFYYAFITRQTNLIGVIFKVYYIYFLIHVTLSYLLSDKYSLAVGLIGITGTLSFAGAWIGYFHLSSDIAQSFKKAKIIVLSLATIQSVGAIINFFYSPDVFGLISNEIYIDSIEDNLNITKRAISFLASPQSLSLYLALSFLFGISAIERKNINVIHIFGLCLIFVSGLLTFSKAFLLTVSMYGLMSIIFYIGKRQVSGIAVLILSVSILVTSSIAEMDIANYYEGWSRFANIATTIIEYSQSTTFEIWMDYLILSASSVVSIFFGNGLGIASRQAQSMNDYIILNGSPESYILQIFFETGLVGLFIFILLYVGSISRLIKKDEAAAKILISCSIVMIGTPAFYGLANGALLWLLIIYGITNKARS